MAKKIDDEKKAKKSVSKEYVPNEIDSYLYPEKTKIKKNK